MNLPYFLSLSPYRPLDFDLSCHWFRKLFHNRMIDDLVELTFDVCSLRSLQAACSGLLMVAVVYVSGFRSTLKNNNKDVPQGKHTLGATFNPKNNNRQFMEERTFIIHPLSAQSAFKRNHIMLLPTIYSGCGPAFQTVPFDLINSLN